MAGTSPKEAIAAANRAADDEMVRELRSGRPPIDDDTHDDRPTQRAAGRPEMSKSVRDTLQMLLDGKIDIDEDINDPLYIDPDIIPDGTTYEWKRDSIYGKDDPAYSAALLRMGWTPVDAARHPELMPARSTTGYIERPGVILMERPAEITRRVRERDRRAARGLIEAKEAEAQGTPTGTLTRENEALKTLAKGFKKSYAPIPGGVDIPDE